MSEARSSVDLCFVMDSTGSMGSYIGTCKDNIQETIQKVVTEHPGTTINLGFVAYRDHCDGAQRIQKFDLNPDVGAFRRFVGSLAATGGGDYPEDVLGGLWEAANNMAWSSPTRVLFHIFDAPPHGRPRFHDESSDSYPDGHPNDRALSEILTRMRDNYLDYYMLKLTNNLEKMVKVFKDEAAAIGYNHLEERLGVKDVSQVMDDVKDAVLDSMAVRVSTKSRPAQRRDALTQPRMEPNLYKVYCGIDFGTHGSAFAYCSVGDPVVRAENWGTNSADVKTLTNLLLGPDKACVEGANAFGAMALEHYLDMNPEEQKKHYFFQRFKMALYEDEIGRDDHKEGVDLEGRLTADNGKRVKSETVLVEALKFMVAHVMEQLRRQYEDVTNPADVQWILTVPAIWSQKARKKMEKAAYLAGVPRDKHDQLIVALEPECASVVAQDSLGLTDGKCFMMVDCGGGTVDIACHKLINNASEVTEIYRATGGPWGSTFIDDEFMNNFLETAFGPEVMGCLEEEQEEDPAVMTRISTAFTNAKVNALPGETKRNVNLSMVKPILVGVFGSVEEVNEHLSRVTYRGVTGGMELKARGMLTLSRAVWDALFGVVIDPLVAHLQHLLDEPELRDRIETLCIVGGFAQSPILMERLRQEFGDSRRIFRPPNPILTVVKGAAKFGLMPTTIAATTAPKTIGIGVRDFWKEGDGEERKKWVRGVGYMVDGVFCPFVRAGDSIPRDMAPVVRYFEPVSYDRFQIEIYQSEDPKPRFVPDRWCGVIGPVDFPSNFDHNAHDICVQVDFSGRMVAVTVQFGEEAPRSVDIDWE